MDKGVDTTQKIVIAAAVILAIVIITVIGFSLYTKAKRAEGELANKVALDLATKKTTDQASISLTGESKNSSGFTYTGLVQKKPEEVGTTTNFGIVDEQAPVIVPEEATDTSPKLPPEEIPVEVTPPVVKPKVVVKKPVVVVEDDDRPLTAEEILRIRQLPVDSSPSGNLQTALEEESEGQYRARY